MCSPGIPDPPALPLMSPPQVSGLNDGTLLALKIGLGLLFPGAGPVVAETLGSLIGHRNQLSITEWLTKLQEQLNLLQLHAEALDNPLKVDEVLAAALAAGQAAQRTHLEEKRETLRRAVLNVALSPVEGADERSVFLRFIDELTPTHLRMLRLIADNKKDLSYVTRHSSLFDKLQEKGMGLSQRDDCYLYFRELLTRDLVHTDSEFGTQEGRVDSMRQRLGEQKDRPMAFMLHQRKQAVGLSSTGERFLAFVSVPAPNGQ